LELTVMTFRVLSFFAATLFVLSGCANSPAEVRQPAPAPSVSRPGPLVPVLKTGEQTAIDLFGDGQASVTLAATKLSTLPGGKDRLVATIDIVLTKAGQPVTGGPENFRFLDGKKALHDAQISESEFPPGLPSVTFATSGQKSHGRIYFDVPAGSVSGGYLQLMTGGLVHAVWGL
jgi:hypothetical protein